MNVKLTIAELEEIMRYNSAEGVHTFSMCRECNKKGCRRYMCNDCIKKEIRKMKGEGN